MTTKVRHWGNSLAIRVPKEIAKKAFLKEGSEVFLSLKNKEIVIIKTEKKKETLRDLVAKITPKNRHELIISGNDIVGKELW